MKANTDPPMPRCRFSLHSSPFDKSLLLSKVSDCKAHRADSLKSWRVRLAVLAPSAWQIVWLA